MCRIQKEKDFVIYTWGEIGRLDPEKAKKLTFNEETAELCAFLR